MTKKNLLSLLIEESKSYMGMDKIKHLIESGDDLRNIPVQPLYISFRSLPIESKTELLPQLSAEQRQAFLDIDLWTKDELSVNDFAQWMYIYSNASDELKYEFVKSPEFAIFLKARFNIWTFDVEDPMYPDHDYYFLTECNQLLVEYDPECEFVDELKDAIKHLYTEEGVENAYTYLFKIIADQIGMMTEDEYRLKKSRLQDYGYVDYYEALELTHHFPSINHLHNFLKKTVAANRPTPEVSDDIKNQRIPYSLVSVFEQQDDGIFNELNKIDNPNREEFLNFNLIKLLNANIEMNGGPKKGIVELSKSSKEAKTLLELGLSYTVKYVHDQYGHEINIFDLFSFTELFKIGKTLILLNQKEIKTTFTKNL